MLLSVQKYALVFSLLLASAAHADFFDISDLAPANGGTWFPGDLSGSLFNDGGSITATFSFTDNGGILTNEPDGTMVDTPYIDLSTGSMLDNSLLWRIDDGTTTGNFVSLSITFSEPIEDPVFTFGDIDTGSLSALDRADDAPQFEGWQDIVVTSAFLNNVEVPGTASGLGSEVGVDAANIHNGVDGNASSANAVSLYGDGGDVPSFADTSLMTTDGNATIQFSGFVDRLLINYYAGRPADQINGQGPFDPESQFIRMSDIAFVPEASSFLLTGVIIGLMGLVTQANRLKSRFLGA